MPTLRNDYDTSWKEVLDTYFQSFMDYCWAEAAEDIDWSQGYEMLDKELQVLTKGAATGKRIIDKLIKVWRKGGEETWVLIHLEVQSQPEVGFAERMFTYNYRLFDRYYKPVASLAILIDDNNNWRPDCYRRELWGCRSELQFRILKLIDYRERLQELQNTSNPFGTVILAQLAALEVHRQSETARLATKIALTRRLYEQGWKKNDVINLYRFIDWTITLSAPYELQYHQEVQYIEEEKHMAYVTTAERIGRQIGYQEGRAQGIADGRAEGMAQGMAQGKVQGAVQAEQHFLLSLLQYKFNSIPNNYRQRIEQANEETLLAWAKRVLDAKTLTDIFED